MTENNRFLLKQFAGEATNNGVFGSYQEGEATTSTDPTAIQSLPAYEQGWEEATTDGSKLPRLEEMQGLQYLLCKAIKELYSEGIPFWMAGETYYTNSICSYFDENNAYALYINISGTNGNNIPPVDTINWKKLELGGETTVDGPELFDIKEKDCLMSAKNESWVNTSAFEWCPVNKYPEAYEHLVSDKASLPSENWTTAEQNATLSSITNWVGIAFDGAKFVAISQNGYISTSTDGETWTTPEQKSGLSSVSNWDGITYGNGIFVALGSNPPYSFGYIATSSDGINWTNQGQKASSYAGSNNRITFIEDQFIIFYSRSSCAKSSNGTSWSSLNVTNSSSSTDLVNFAYGNGKGIVLSKNGYLAVYTNLTDSIALQINSTLSSVTNWVDVIFDGAKFVAISQNGYISTSTDGETWTTPEQKSGLSSVSNWKNGVKGTTKCILLSQTAYLSEKENIIKTYSVDNITILYYQAEDEHKICLADQEQNLIDLYNATGLAWFYLLDEENERFKLPRVKWGFDGLKSTMQMYFYIYLK